MTETIPSSYETFFSSVTGHGQPHGWQKALAASETPENRLVRIPTGFGKTQGVLSAWLWNRVILGDDRWPRRLVWCLPMRVLVEQTEQEVKTALSLLEILWKEKGSHNGKIGVHRLMGGADAGEWHLYPEECAVLIGTQDMLLSRALNRGYASPRARWPMEFGQLQQDALWVMDEVQLMDVGLATSAQIQAFRDDDQRQGKTPRPAWTWWMSATLQPDWLQKSPDTMELTQDLPVTRIPVEARSGPLWDGVTKPVELRPVENDKAFASLIQQAHLDKPESADSPTLVVVNRVETAVQLYEKLAKDKSLQDADAEIRLIHSRFRPAERASWRDEFLNKAACQGTPNRIIISTQVVEAGVDISASLLVTELAPWASLVQRFGRCARWGGKAQVLVIDTQPKDDKAAAPYAVDELAAAREALGLLEDVSPLHLEHFEESHSELLADLYPYAPRHLLLRHELDELFDTTPDLTGADIDISRFIRSGDERDLQVFWEPVAKGENPTPDIQPSRDALCNVPFLKAQDWLFGKENKLQSRRAWAWDWLNGIWREAERRDLYPGQTLLVDTASGGYSTTKGWSKEAKEAVPAIAPVAPPPAEQADAAQDDEALSAYPWKTIATHGRETGELASAITRALAPSLEALLHLAGRWHDSGKAPPQFQGSMGNQPATTLFAKAPPAAWLPLNRLYPMPDGSRRPGFRHELVSVLALFSVLQRARPDHPALLGPWRELLTAMGTPMEEVAGATAISPIEREILDLEPADFNLLAYLVCAHHGKVRLAWHACPADQEAGSAQPRIRGIEAGDAVPAIPLCDSGGAVHELPPFTAQLDLASAGLNPRTGASWTERVLGLIDTHGVFTLAWLESLLRAADQRASRLATPDPLLEKENP